MQIESGIPIPELQSARSEAGRIARRMEVGQSVLCADEDQALKLRDALRAAKFKASMRKQEDQTFRVWRIA